MEDGKLPREILRREIDGLRRRGRHRKRQIQDCGGRPESAKIQELETGCDEVKRAEASCHGGNDKVIFIFPYLMVNL